MMRPVRYRTNVRYGGDSSDKSLALVPDTESEGHFATFLLSLRWRWGGYFPSMG